VCVFVCVCKPAHLRMFVCPRACGCMWAHVNVHAHLGLHLCTHLRVRMQVCRGWVRTALGIPASWPPVIQIGFIWASLRIGDVIAYHMSGTSAFSNIRTSMNPQMISAGSSTRHVEHQRKRFDFRQDRQAPQRSSITRQKHANVGF
jgi:hypothetical protein